MKLISYLYLLIATIIWALAPALVKYALVDIDPFYFLFMRFLVVSILLIPFLIHILRKKYSRYDWFNIIFYSVMGQVGLLFYFKGLDLTTATDTIILYLLGPLLTIAAGHYFYKEKLSFVKKLGMTIAFFGALIVAVEPLLSQTNGTAKDRFTGNILILIATLLGTFWIIHSKFLFGKNSTKFISLMKNFGLKFHKKKYNYIDFNIFTFYIAFMVMIPFYIFNFESYNLTTLNLGLESVGVILYMAIFSSIIAYILFIKAQAVLDVSEVSILGYISPLFSLPASFLILGEIPNIWGFIGLSLIFLGIALAEFQNIKSK
jgi:drug/metabolite transporter (DMT)-like permease